MKSSEFLKEVKRKGWVLLRQGKGSYQIFTKNGIQVTIPYHGSKELGKGLEMKLGKEMGL